MTLACIHQTAVVHPGARLGEGVEVGPFGVIGEHVVIGDGTWIGPHVWVDGHTSIGQRCQVFPGATLGGPPQDHKYRGQPTQLIIGDDNLIREGVSIHRSNSEEEPTRIGARNMIMAFSHIGHNCQIGDDVMITNNCPIGGHVVIEDRAVLGGMVGVHQFVRIGTIAMVGGYSKVVRDVPPFTICDGRPAQPCGLNVVGLRRAGVSAEARDQLKRAYHLLFRSGLNLSHALAQVQAEVNGCEEVSYLVAFLSRLKDGRAGRQFQPS